MRHLGFNIILVAAIGFGSIEASAQSLAKRWLFGFGAGTQQLYGDAGNLIISNINARLGIGGEGLAGYRFNDRIGVTLAAGYATLPFNIRVLGVTAPLETNIIYGNLLFDVELVNSGSFHPYFMFGVGGINFQVQNSKRYNDATGIAGLGFRLFLSPNVALNANGAFHYTTGDDLDIVNQGAQDGYASARVGLTFFRGAGEANRDNELFAEYEEIEASSSSLENRLGKLESSSTESSEGMQNYIRLKSQKDELGQEIDDKEREIASLLAAVEENKRQVSQMQSSATSAPAMTSGSFSRVYEQALNNFYKKQYPQAIQMFSELVGQYPSHSLASNCYYWMGEAQFHSGSFAEAVNSLNRVLQAPKSLKKDDALFYLGKSYMQMNRREEARQALNRLKQEHPASEFIPKADELLQQI